jgi:hypothetical protein
MNVVDHHTPLWQQREAEHARQMRIVAGNVALAAVLIAVYMLVLI